MTARGVYRRSATSLTATGCYAIRYARAFGLKIFNFYPMTPLARHGMNLGASCIMTVLSI